MITACTQKELKLLFPPLLERLKLPVAPPHLPTYRNPLILADCESFESSLDPSSLSGEAEASFWVPEADSAKSWCCFSDW